MLPLHLNIKSISVKRVIEDVTSYFTHLDTLHFRGNRGRMSLTRENILANFGGKAWTVLISLVVVPIYLNFLGTEAYGIVGIYASMTGVLAILDLGLGTILSQEMARLANAKDAIQFKRQTTRALEVVYWATAVAIGVGVWAASPFLASSWVNAVELPVATVETALMLAGVAIASQWPFALYSGGMIGLERQVQLNIISVGCATLKAVGAIFVLVYVAKSVTVFFAWQAVVGGLQTVLLMVLFWRAIDGGFWYTRFEWKTLRRLLPAGFALAGIATTAVIVTQIDKVVLVRFAPLDVVGIYTLVATVSGVLFHLPGPVYSAFLPRLTREAAQGDAVALSRSYHLGCQIVAALVLPVAAVGSVFSGDLLSLWTGNLQVAQQGAGLLSLLLAGNAASSLLQLPYALQLAGGTMKVPLLVNVISAATMVPLALGLITLAGAKGAAWAWLILNLGYVFGGMWAFHRAMLPKELFRWYARDVLPALLISVLVTASARAFLPDNVGVLGMVFWIAASVLAAVIGSIGVSSELRGPTLGLAIRSVLRSNK